MSCSENDSSAVADDLENYIIVLNVNGQVWKGTNGQATINDASGNSPNAFMLLGASKEGNTSGVPDFVSMLSGTSLMDGNTILMKGGFNNGEYFSLRHNGKDYATNKAPDEQEVGMIKILNYGTVITGELSGVLYAENGDTIVVSEGVLSFEVRHF